jgi:streptomycin 6-kinase
MRHAHHREDVPSQTEWHVSLTTYTLAVMTCGPMPAKLEHYLTAWHLSDPQPLARTPTSHLYTVTWESDTVVLKLLTDYGWEEQRGASALRYFDGRGAVRLYRSDAAAQLLEYASGEELIGLVERGDDPSATRIIAAILNQLHGGPQGKHVEGLSLLRDWFRQLFSKADSDRAARADSIYVRGADLAARLLAEPREVCVLHGDVHHRNIRQSPRGWLVFDPKGLVGERTYDCANTLCNPFRGQARYDDLVHNERRLLTNAGILADGLAIELARVLQFTFAYACLSAAWSLTIHDSDATQWALNVATLLEPHVSC